MSQKVQRLEQALHFWEDFCYLIRLSVRSEMFTEFDPDCLDEGPINHSPRLRRYLLGYKGKSFDYKRFEGSPTLNETLQDYRTLPFALARWISCSRRVFNVAHDLQLLLDNTSMRGIKWSDVSWPFDSFAITLDVPIVNEQGIGFDCIIITKHTPLGYNHSIFEFRLLPERLEAHKPLSKKWKSKDDRLLKKKNLVKLYSRLEHVFRLNEIVPTQYTRFYLDEEHIGSRDITESISRLVNDGLSTSGHNTESMNIHYPEWDSAVRIVLGLCLYLTTLPTHSSQRSEWKPMDRSESFDPKAITSEAEICTVSSVHSLTGEEQQVFAGGLKGKGSEKCTHFRRGHWRCAPGYGDIPNAPKNVWVRPVLIRADRLPEDGIPGGSMSRVK